MQVSSTLNIDKEIPIIHEMTTNEELQNLALQITKNIIDYLDPIIQQIRKVSENNSDCIKNLIVEKTSFSQHESCKTAKTRDIDLSFEKEMLQIKLEEAEKENKLLRNEVIDITNLLNAKIQSPPYNVKTPTKELLYTDNRSDLSTTFPIPLIDTPDGNLLNNDTFLMNKRNSIVPLIANIKTPNVNVDADKELQILSFNKETEFINKNYLEKISINGILEELEIKSKDNSNDINVSEKVPFKSSRLVNRYFKNHREDKIVGQNQHKPTQFKSARLISSEKFKGPATTDLSVSKLNEEKSLKESPEKLEKLENEEILIKESPKKLEPPKTEESDVKNTNNNARKKIRKKNSINCW